MIEEQENGAASEPIIMCRDVHKWFGQFHVLRGVTTSVERSEKLVVVGPSGQASPPSSAPSTDWRSTSAAKSWLTACR